MKINYIKIIKNYLYLVL